MVAQEKHTCTFTYLGFLATLYTNDTQIWLARSTFLQSLAPTLIKLTYLGFSNDPEDTD